MKKTLLSLLLLVLSPLALAQDIQVMHPYARAVPPGQMNSAAFMMLKNAASEQVSLVKATSPAANVVELHNHIMDDGVMKMRQVEDIKVPAEGMAELKPGGFHVMLIGLKQNLNEGDQIQLKLHFSNGEMADLELPVKKVQMGMKHKH
ncbi:copper chaperone PCu(A)C [Oceanospirillum sediminis]|uniref:Copper chaperone PCu(A)C n=1 Tax=Oceanospirillum sediminis TaxID=2760088 RepID=A0A839IMA8_9GAMM|nr:copper chaperone PCu(A)C [Oceanospirillum sediminis]MBB1486533.1 copper chaperone PCu(A)C [Oceanospirillum sediminis]